MIDATSVTALTDEAGNSDGKISGNLNIYLYTSTAAGVISSENGAPDPSVVMGVTSGLALEQQWPATDRQMNGLAFAIVKLRYNRDADTTSLKPITFRFTHALFGTGVAKPGDVWLDYIASQVYGGAVDAAFVDADSADALNDYSDEIITFTDSEGDPATQPRYRINGVMNAASQVLNNIDAIMSASDSWMSYNAPSGKWAIVINKAEDTAFYFDDDNIVGDIRVSVTDLTGSINQVVAQFPFATNRDQPAFVTIDTPPELLYPNEPANKYSITYELVNDSVQAHYLANRLLEQAREDLIISFATTYYGIQVEAGQVVSVTNANYGWDEKLFRAIKVSEASLPDGGLGAKIELIEYNPQVYDDQDITQFQPIPNSGLSSPIYFSALAAPVVTGYPSASSPNFSVTCYVPATGRVTFGNLFFTTSATPTSADWNLLANASTSDSQPVANNTYYTFSNLTLGEGTYYFAYLVGNQLSQSTLSASSLAFVWTPQSVVGTRTAILDMYKWSATQPVSSFPSGTSTYTWATGQFTAPATPNGWSLTPATPVIGETLWIARTIYADNDTTETSVVTWSATASYPISSSGVNGTRTAFLELYRWSLTTPTTFPSGTSTYTWATGAFTAPATLNSWSLLPGATTPGYTLYGCSVAYADQLTSATSVVTWTTSTAYAVGAAGATGPTGATGATGSTGATGPRNAQVYFFYSTGQSSAPTAPTTAQVSYNFTTQTASITTSGWSTTFSPSAVSATSATNKYWAVLCVFQETTFGGAYSETISPVFTWQNLDGLVTFTNLANSQGSGGTTTTFIDGGSITTDTLSVNKIKSNTSGTFNTYVTFGLGTGSNIGGYTAGGAFISTNFNKFALLAHNSGTGFGFGSGTSNDTDYTVGGVNAVGGVNVAVTAWKTSAYIGTGIAGGTFQGGGGGYTSAGIYSDIRLAYYTGTNYAYYITSGTTGPFTASHDGLQLLTDTTPALGDIMVDVALIAAPNVNDCITQMAVSTVANQSGVIGVMAGECNSDFVPASLGCYVEGLMGCKNEFVLKPEFADIYETYRPLAVNAIGEGKINVCGQGGNIAIGDLIVASDTAGKGMKQADDIVRSYTVAKSRETVTFTGSEIKQIACIYLGG